MHCANIIYGTQHAKLRQFDWHPEVHVVAYHCACFLQVHLLSLVDFFLARCCRLSFSHIDTLFHLFIEDPTSFSETLLLQEVDGYTHEIPQDWMLDDMGEDWLQHPQRPSEAEWPKSKICHPLNKLSSKQLFEMGEVAHKIVLAIRCDKEDGNREPLRRLGFRARKQATDHLSRLGRTGRLV
jgi:hypothetical protein